MSVANVTVFGGSGFVGRHVVRKLARAGAGVRVAVRHPDRALFLKSMGDVGQITPVATNIRDDASVTAAVAGSDAVINLVGVLYEAGRQTFDAVHHQGSGRIAHAAKTAGVGHLVQVSAIGADIEAGSKYARSKAAGEAAVRVAFPNAAVIRPSIVFGADDNFFNLTYSSLDDEEKEEYLKEYLGYINDVEWFIYKLSDMSSKLVREHKEKMIRSRYGLKYLNDHRNR